MEPESDYFETSPIVRVTQVFTKSGWVRGTEDAEKIQPLAQGTHTPTMTTQLSRLLWLLLRSRMGELHLRLGIITS